MRQHPIALRPRCKLDFRKCRVCDLNRTLAPRACAIADEILRGQLYQPVHAVGARALREGQQREPVERAERFIQAQLVGERERKSSASPSESSRTQPFGTELDALAKELVGNRIGRKRCRKTKHRCRAGRLLLRLRDRRAERRKDRARILAPARSVLEMLVDALQDIAAD